MSTEKEPDYVGKAIERAMARIGCPPGDNSDADLYGELRSALSELEARPSPTREQIADRIREEYAKHPTLDWADLAAAKILSSMRDVAQPPAQEMVEAADRMAMHVNRVESLAWAPGDDIRRAELIRARLDYMDARAALAAHPKDPAPTVEKIMDEFEKSVDAATEPGDEDDGQDWIDISDVRIDLRARLTKLLTNP